MKGMNTVDYCVSYIVHTTRYTAYQCYRVLEIVAKYGDKAYYHVTRKQKKILDIIVCILKGRKENENAGGKEDNSN